MKNRLIGLIIVLFTFLLLGPTTFARCSDTKPAKPVLLSAQAGDKNITLNWQEVPDPVTYYLVRYGTSKENLEYGNPNIGGRGATSFTIGELQNGVEYFFQIRAGNGCKPGNFSDTVSAISGNPGELEGGSSEQPHNLTLYKEVLGVDISATANAKRISTPSAFPNVRHEEPIDPCKTTCYGLPLLAGQITILFLFFIASLRWPTLKPIFSVIVPVITLSVFYGLNGKCGANSFYCEYFIPLTVITYVIMLVAQKYILIDIDRKNK
ncbi:hypothetical protein A3G67_03785 [Candidatus Roizmanbacteria bacterium RIFCSPLOWO2_12_FULL_40_12]|uniref:Fibronectin type-III domain-containing protein n=1 Tax=Candidatus Roizmanbacteria bacterium RIFCSPLOWO2_01_FULL_40_42 TaxID=1802066 RepID=A0A1F7J5R1_9BACT|nr:MAG: hypothetical protein A2779_03420 [Candidatus Roizmanbacteria bacterium RIFCSPHIGHO2_01_FULL_40_98]OGK28385.1 MAG: hypothetical protein A3C31_00785 [Candidatus Roizmanbacteria bacterium RIFCSPHIGHO2_02_FULL_40_53]OGK30621.1 MAG: hypothetical protein A2W49_03470 [Candidatus Roizmanbacteria bacterium RIFCSPHIGHO2_12_41_18]OGK37035.1 MAG: hypothetical protein A3E69_01045 [Candidatus Roizmanbacteria bacterium RIFCSPHIGHO2_12_FULL_40_130]OGK50941.1 MAG: hypothetical protein A3B50_01555 [Candi